MTTTGIYSQKTKRTKDIDRPKESQSETDRQKQTERDRQVDTHTQTERRHEQTDCIMMTASQVKYER